jgi:hypothetical protein
VALREQTSADLVILAAQDFTSEPVARVHLPARIPLGLHGSWIAGQSIPHETTPPAPQAGLAVTHEGVVMTLVSNMAAVRGA